jgi:gamma-glutamylcyclotransferase (GGCT)/AIG2-like uncharacterized protein YtfP
MILREPDLDENNLLFVYGTLLSGLSNHHYMAGATCLGPATLPGVLFDLGSYPGLRVTGELAQPLDLVLGELYKIEPSQWAHLDGLEQFDPHSEINSMYLRQWAHVTWLKPDLKPNLKTEAATTLRVQVYVYNWPLEGRPRIENGDFRRHVLNQSA